MTKVTDPSTGAALVIDAPSGVTPSATTPSFSFGAVSKPSMAASWALLQETAGFAAEVR